MFSSVFGDIKFGLKTKYKVNNKKKEEKNDKRKKTIYKCLLYILIVLIVICLTSFGVYFYLNNFNKKKESRQNMVNIFRPKWDERDYNKFNLDNGIKGLVI